MSAPSPAAVSPAMSDEAAWATEAEVARALWILLRPGYLIAFFVAGWGADVFVFQQFRVEYHSVLSLGKDELVAPWRLCGSALAIAALLGCVHRLALSWAASVPPAFFQALPLVAYALPLFALFAWLPKPLARRVRWRGPFARALWRCIRPEPTKEVPFVEVLVADGLTSVAKVLFDLAMGTCVVLRSTGFSTSSYLSLWLPQSSAQTSAEAPLRSRLGGGLEECSRSYTPFFFWALPFLIRARQCVLTSRHTQDATNRELQKINLAKYLTALPIVVFALCYAVADVRYEWLGGMSAEDFEICWAFAAVINSTFSFMWDMVMDWGLLQPMPLRASNIGLRPILLFHGIWGFYYMAILCNATGRMLWSLRWSPEALSLLGSIVLTFCQQGAEVLRRVLWNIIRVEWECVKKGIYCADKTCVP